VPPEPDLRSEDFADCEFDLAAACGVQNPVRLRRELPRDTTACIERFAAGAELHTDTVVHGAWAYALARLTGRQSVAFGGAVTGSRVGSPDDQGAISRIRGFRLVTARVEPARSSADLLYAIQRRTVDLAPSASFDTIAALVPEPVRPCTPRLGIRVSTLSTFDAKPYPLSFSMESGPCWTARLDYQAAALSDRVAQAVLGDAVAFLGAIAAEPGRSLGALGRIGNRLDAGPRRARAA
jgi:hypothetical protein